VFTRRPIPRLADLDHAARDAKVIAADKVHTGGKSAYVIRTGLQVENLPEQTGRDRGIKGSREIEDTPNDGSLKFEACGFRPGAFRHVFPFVPLALVKIEGGRLALRTVRIASAEVPALKGCELVLGERKDERRAEVLEHQ
jgi:hypothetical protein